MKIYMNNQAHELPAGATLADAIAVLQPAAPFAAAINMTFVPNTRYRDTPLSEGDRIDVIAPVTGG
ncbi:MAG: thiamine biosynthesis protein ThiS [Burkholderiales bacterium PBB1]|nr:MAG: thiamine biosynthesis protein ThiS [Burkholderiales bacterium PBB1]